jgi:hypothetical protein
LWQLWHLSKPMKKLTVAPKMALLAKGLWPFGLVSVLTLVYVKADTLLLERLVGLPAVGIYQSAYKEMVEATENYDYAVSNTDGEFADTILHVIEILKREGYQVSGE